MKLEKFININWYIERKPYTIHSDYDLFYLKICRDLFTIIDKLASRHRDAVDLEAEDCRELAYNCTAYFEDRVNRIGFWEALTALHQQQFGKRLPFFDAGELQQQEEEYEDILPADIHYLAFLSYINLMATEEGQTLVLFEKPFITELAAGVFAYLDAIEEVQTTDYYESWLKPQEDYIEFKKQLDWFTFDSYLTGIEFSRKHDEYLLRLMADTETDQSFLGPLLYEEEDRLMFTQPSSWTAFFPVDLLAGAMRCSNQKKEEIRNLIWRPHGIFQLLGETATHHQFRHTATREEFRVLKSSLNTPLDHKDRKYWITTLAAWNGDHSISGMCFTSPYKEQDLLKTNLQFQHSFQTHFKAYRDQLREMALKQRDKAVEFFGQELIVFDTGKEMQDRIIEFQRWYHDTVVDKSKSKAEFNPALFALPADMLSLTDIALFIPPADGLQFIMDHKQLLHLLQNPEPDKVTLADIQEAEPSFLDKSVSADYWYCLRRNYTLPNLSLFLKCPVERDEDFEACLRIYKPEEFSPRKLPQFSLFDSQKIDLQTVQEAFSMDKEKP